MVLQTCYFTWHLILQNDSAILRIYIFWRTRLTRLMEQRSFSRTSSLNHYAKLDVQIRISELISTIFFYEKHSMLLIRSIELIMRKWHKIAANVQFTKPTRTHTWLRDIDSHTTHLRVTSALVGNFGTRFSLFWNTNTCRGDITPNRLGRVRSRASEHISWAYTVQRRKLSNKIYCY